MRIPKLNEITKLFATDRKPPANSEAVRKARLTLMAKEMLATHSTLYDKSQYRPYNPAELYQKRSNYDLYDKIREDDQVHAVISLKKNIVLGAGWYIDSEKPKIKEFWETALKQNYSDKDSSTLESSLYQILTAFDYGNSTSELIFAAEPVSGFGNKPYWILKKLKTVPPHSIEFHTDDFGNIEKIVQWDYAGHSGKVPPQKLLIYTYQEEFGNPYGRSDLSVSVYRSWWSKDNIIKFQNIGLERVATQFPVGKYPEGSDDESIDEFEKAIYNLQAKMSMVMQNDFELEMHGGKVDFSEAFNLAIDKHNLMIARALLIPDLLGLSGAQSKSGGLGSNMGANQFNLFLAVMKKHQRDISALLNERIIMPLTKLNFGKDAEAEIKFKDLTKEQEYEALKIYSEFLKTGHKPDIEQKIWFMDTIGAPTSTMEKEEKQRIKEEKENPQQPIPGQAPQQPGQQPNQPPGQQPQPQQQPVQPTPTVEQQITNKPKAENTQKTLVESKYNGRALTGFEKKMDFAAINNDMDDTNTKYVDILSNTIQKVIDDLLTKIRKKKIIEQQKFNLINELEITGIRNIEKDIRDNMTEAYRKGVKSTKKIRTNAVADVALDDSDVAAWLNSAAQYVANEEAAQILKVTKGTLMDAIKKGKGVQETIKMLQDEYDGWDKVGGAHRIETIVRTNTTKAYNQARAEQFSKLDQDLAGYQYSAILDGRTSDICNELHGKVLKPSEADKYNPPLHFNCRSLLVPILRDELEKEGEQFGDFASVDNVNTVEEKGGFMKLGKEGK